TFDMQAIYRSVVLDDAASRGTTLVDVDGNRFLDLFSSFALGALGYNHPAIRAVVESPAFAAASANPTSTPFVTTPLWFDLMERLQIHAPAGMSRVYCVDAGGEGVESALKVAFIKHGEARRRAAGLPVNPLEAGDDAQRAWMDNVGTDAVIVSFAGAFHGRGLGPLSATHSKVIHKADLPAFPWPTVPFPASRWPLDVYAAENAAAEQASLDELDRVLDAHAGRVAAIIVEPMQSEGGDRHASPAFFRGVQARAKAAGASFILDEVQTGMGISGTFWLHEQLDLPEPPSMVTFGKKMQIGGFFAAPSHDVRQFGRMYQTRNGDRARVMIGVAVLEAIARDGLLGRVRDVGAHLLSGLQELERRHPALVSQARGRGFLLAFDLPTVASRDAFLQAALRRGVFATYTGARSVRLRPHLITSRADVDLALGVFDATLRELHP
ncbi:MAG TPA: aminotransferase class III-fold pyridoxal phosphate-dependent enzyme, partial [Myxococcota bacterium]|nr:aminotransferase class III-fold pyridoxal phosphate-dependent enzyme [Myxococcota bacterium]